MDGCITNDSNNTETEVAAAILEAQTALTSAPIVGGAELAQLAAQIDAEHQAAEHAAHQALHHACQVGKLLTEVKARLPHGQLLQWVSDNCTFCSRTAQNYMRIFEHWPQLQDHAKRVSHLTIRDALELLASWPSGRATVSDVGLVLTPPRRRAVLAAVTIALRTAAEGLQVTTMEIQGLRRYLEHVSPEPADLLRLLDRVDALIGEAERLRDMIAAKVDEAETPVEVRELLKSVCV